ncbi:hypothetical protein BH09PSE2_BH09PSE2_23620 [soil metagenome]
MAQDALDQALRRLDTALSALERRFAEREAGPDLFAAPAAEPERVSALEAQVDAMRDRERALEQVAAEASAALGRAAAEVRAALNAEA